ncbi:MAG: GDP-fucose synthetase [Bacteroidetes bacterium]|nr:GDP-fucose synthetase [Bacteroidota bacterium]
MNKNSKIYVAGHTGLVGSAIVRALEAKGYTNIVGKSFEELDLRDQNAVATYFEETKPEYVFLAAAKVGGIVANNTYRAEFIYENLMIQNNIIHQSYLNNVKKLLFLGSTCIYPKNAPQPLQEDALLSSQLEYTNEPYAIAKIAGIKLIESYNLQYGTNYLAVMPTNIYGPYDNFDLEKSHVLPALIRKIHLGKCLEENKWDEIKNDLNRRPIEGVSGNADKTEILEKLGKYGIIDKPGQVEIWGTGKPMREFLWSEELASACVFVVENVNFDDLHNGSGEILNTHINIGTSEEISIYDLAHKIKGIIGYKGELVFNSDKPDGTMRKVTNTDKIHDLGWKHEIKIDQGIEKLYNWYTS